MGGRGRGGGEVKGQLSGRPESLLSNTSQKIKLAQKGIVLLLSVAITLGGILIFSLSFQRQMLI